MCPACACAVYSVSLCSSAVESGSFCTGKCSLNSDMHVQYCHACWLAFSALLHILMQVRPTEMALACGDSYVRVFDRRMMSLGKAGSVPASLQQARECLCRAGADRSGAAVLQVVRGDSTVQLPDRS